MSCKSRIEDKNSRKTKRELEEMPFIASRVSPLPLTIDNGETREKHTNRKPFKAKIFVLLLHLPFLFHLASRCRLSLIERKMAKKQNKTNRGKEERRATTTTGCLSIRLLSLFPIFLVPSHALRRRLLPPLPPPHQLAFVEEERKEEKRPRGVGERLLFITRL